MNEIVINGSFFLNSINNNFKKILKFWVFPEKMVMSLFISGFFCKTIRSLFIKGDQIKDNIKNITL